MSADSRSLPAHEFVAGRLCLNWVNTSNRPETGPRSERLRSYRDLIAWSRRAGVIDEARARCLERRAERSPAAAEAVVTRARIVREAIYRIFLAVSQQKAPAPEDVQLFNQELAQVLARAELRVQGSSFAWAWNDDEGALDQLLWPVVKCAADLITSPEAQRVRQCDGVRCSWLFLDCTKNRRRRWCEMKVCGNRAKVQRHRARHKDT